MVIFPVGSGWLFCCSVSGAPRPCIPSLRNGLHGWNSFAREWFQLMNNPLLHEAKVVLVPPPFHSILSPRWLMPATRRSVHSSDAAKVESGESGGVLLPIPWLVACAEVSSLDKVFMTRGQFTADGRELPTPAGRR